MKFYCFYKDRNIDDIYNQLLFVFIFKGMGYFHNRFLFQNSIFSIDFTRNLEFLKEYLLNCDFKAYGYPKNSPVNRIEQFINFIKNCNYNIVDIIKNIITTSSNFEEFNSKIMDYFNENLSIGKISNKKIKILSYNLILPIIYLYFKENNLEYANKRIINFFFSAKSFENNKILTIIYNTLCINLNKKAVNELEIQGYYYLYNAYCKKKDCNNCCLYKKLK